MAFNPILPATCNKVPEDPGEPVDQDLDFCWEQILRIDGWFRLHYLFSPDNRGDQLVALHALFSMLEKALTLSDENLSVAQLAWCRSELSPPRANTSAHPVVRSLAASRAWERLPGELLEELFRNTMARIDPEPLNDQQSLKAFCDRLGRSRLLLEIALSDDWQDHVKRLDGRCAGTGFFLLAKVPRNPQSRPYWFVPLELLARHQCTAQDLERGSDAAAPCLQELGELGEEWFQDQLAAIRAATVNSGKKAGQRRHLVAMTEAQRIQFARLLKRPVDSIRKRTNGWGIRDLFRVWSEARRP